MTFTNCIHMSTYNFALLHFNMVRQWTRDLDYFTGDPRIVGGREILDIHKVVYFECPEGFGSVVLLCLFGLLLFYPLR